MINHLNFDGDRLVWLLKHFELRARVFHAGTLPSGIEAAAETGVGYLHLLHSGGVRVVSGDGICEAVSQPSALLYMSPKAHRIEPMADRAQVVCAGFEFGIGQCNPLHSALPELYVLRLEDSPALALTLRQLFRESEEEHCGRNAILDRLSEVALILILRDLMDERRLEIGLLAGLADPKLSRAISAIHTHPDHGWTVDRLADEAAMSRARFADRFHEVVGTSPGTYLGDWRVGLAKSLLLKGKTIQTIAAEVGYGSASALSRAFTGRCGMSPSEWRRLRLS